LFLYENPASRENGDYNLNDTDL